MLEIDLEFLLRKNRFKCELEDISANQARSNLHNWIDPR
jgi:hypothetical protein